MGGSWPRACAHELRTTQPVGTVMASKKGRQQGAQRHAEGQHGGKTHKRFVEQLQEGTRAPKKTEGAPVEGHHRLLEDRQQHDEAEKGSEKVKS